MLLLHEDNAAPSSETPSTTSCVSSSDIAPPTFFCRLDPQIFLNICLCVVLNLCSLVFVIVLILRGERLGKAPCSGSGGNGRLARAECSVLCLSTGLLGAAPVGLLRAFLSLDPRAGGTPHGGRPPPSDQRFHFRLKCSAPGPWFVHPSPLLRRSPLTK